MNKPASTIVDIFKDDKREYSSTRVSMLTGVGVLSIVVLYTTFMGKPDATIIGIYASLCAGVYGIGKISSDSVEKASMNPPPADPPEIKMPGPTTEIHIGDGKTANKEEQNAIRTRTKVKR